MTIPGYADRLCPCCGTFTQHEIIKARWSWRCLNCDHVTCRKYRPDHNGECLNCDERHEDEVMKENTR